LAPTLPRKEVGGAARGWGREGKEGSGREEEQVGRERRLGSLKV